MLQQKEITVDVKQVPASDKDMKYNNGNRYKNIFA